MSNNDLKSKLEDLGISVPDSCIQNGVCILKEKVICFEVDDKHPTVKPLINIINSLNSKPGVTRIYIILCTETYVKTKNKPLLINIYNDKNESFYNNIPFTTSSDQTTYHNDVIMNNTHSQDTRIWCKPFKSETDKDVIDKIKPNIPVGTGVDEFIRFGVTYNLEQTEAYVPIKSNLGKYIEQKYPELDKSKFKRINEMKNVDLPARYEIDKIYTDQIINDYSMLLTPNHMAFNNLKFFKITASIPDQDKETTDKEKNKFYASFRIHIFYTQIS